MFLTFNFFNVPELPEVETIRTDLAKKILHQPIIQLEILHNKPVGGKSGAVRLKRALTKNSIIAVERIGKLLFFALNNKKYLAIHLKMTGQLIYVHHGHIIAGGHSMGPSDLKVPNNFTRVTFTFANGDKLYFNDTRLFGYIKLIDQLEKDRIIGTYGIEPLSHQFTLDAWKNIVSTKRMILKALLLNQSFIAGIGNIYADEVCHAAKVLPHRRTHTLKPKEITLLHTAIIRILKLAIHHRGTTFNNYVDSQGRTGKFVSFLKVYGRKGEFCKTCKKGIIHKTTVAGRGTHSCPVCQK